VSTMEQTMTLFVRKGYRFHHTGWRIHSRRRFSCGSQLYVGPLKRVCFFSLESMGAMKNTTIINPWSH